ncbi:MAG TPA: peptidoglycan editing factor PgeF [Bacillales bacterium]|nr:peptidoglycan editing factor PgeF [Bacillales bacterium]
MDREPFALQQQLWLKLVRWERVMAGITTRNGGKSDPPYDHMNLGFHVQDDPDAVLANRERAAQAIGVPLHRWVCAEQVHGADIEKVTTEDAGRGAKRPANSVPAVDGLYTRDGDVLLVLGYADCVPLYFSAPRHGLVGIAHAGWRGTAANIAGHMVDRWVKEEGVPVDNIFAAVGPSIGGCCYEVDDRVIEAVDAALGPKAGKPYRQTNGNRYLLDLKECNRKLFLQAGISENHIECSCYCTSCRTDLFYSHRKENGRTGRMSGFIGMCGRQ